MRKVRTRTFQAFVARHSHFETGPAPIPISFDRAKRWVSYNIRPCHGGLWIGARPNGGTGRSRSNFGSRPALSAVPLLLAFSGHSAIFSNRETGRHSRTQKLELSLLATMPSKLRVRNRTRGLLSQELTGAFRGAFEIESDNIATFLFTFFDYSIPFTAPSLHPTSSDTIERAATAARCTTSVRSPAGGISPKTFARQSEISLRCILPYSRGSKGQPKQTGRGGVSAWGKAVPRLSRGWPAT